jgi:hypothetical protein
MVYSSSPGIGNRLTSRENPTSDRTKQPFIGLMDILRNALPIGDVAQLLFLLPEEADEVAHHRGLVQLSHDTAPV